ncbi:MAG: DUF805 domain-containing protein [Microbacteriaceae bacterium]
MNFSQAVTAGFKNYAQFRGTATKPEFWYWFLFSILVSVVTSTIDNVISPSGMTDASSLDALSSSGMVNNIASIALALPSLTVGIRRMRDAGFSAWWLLAQGLPLIPLTMTIVTFVNEVTATGLIEDSSQLLLAPVYLLGAMAASASDPAYLEQLMTMFQGTFLWFGITLLVSLAVMIFFFVIYLRPTKTFEQGNKLVAPSQAQPVTETTA